MPAKGQTTYVLDRVAAKTRYEDECWIFTGKLTGRGYGNIWHEGKMVRLNRLICHLVYGADLDDDSWTANHKPECKSKACWRPDHLYAGTQAENVKDQIEAGTFHYGTANLSEAGNGWKYIERNRK